MKKASVKKGKNHQSKKFKNAELIDGSPTPMSSSRLRDLLPTAINLEKENSKKKN